MSRESREEPLAAAAGPTADPRFELAVALGNEVRAGQRATDIVDDLICHLLGINRTDARCLDILDHHGRLTAGQLAAESGLTSGAVTAMIDRLERHGYARRVHDPSDRRRVFVEQTEKAQQAAWELMGERMRELARPLYARYTIEELELLLEFQRLGREIQEDQAEWLRARLEERGRGS
jgi:DNA-binding MarR family transcriptional regulator